jgi:hypothetical protein
MKLRLLLILSILFLLFWQAVEAQKVILLQKPGKSKRYLYYPGDKIAVRMGDPEFIAGGDITYIDDSICIVNKNFSIPLSRVKEVRRTRHFLNGSWRLMFVTAGVYAGGSIINHAINNETPVFDNTIPIVSGSFIALGTISYLLRYKHCKMENGWVLKVLDYDIFKEKKEVKE